MRALLREETAEDHRAKVAAGVYTDPPPGYFWRGRQLVRWGPREDPRRA